MERAELEARLGALGVPDSVADGFLALFDAADGEVGKRDFKDFFKEAIDTDDDCKLSAQEISAIFTAVGYDGATEAEIQAMIDAHDAGNADGLLSFREMGEMKPAADEDTADDGDDADDEDDTADDE